ncbi:MAG: AprI/Inh family metalloprotease inhibitor [Alphaproteobacteria bacterium]|nr:AprI/Inh family metalloprotease inhibitor [Alphaproteobacteria bacterium]
MRFPLIAAGLAGAGLLSWPMAAGAADHEAGAPLTPSEAAGTWTVESQGRSICAVTLSAQPSTGGYAAKASGCGEAIPGAPVAWRPTADGMALVGADGRTLIAFDRWSNSLFVSHRSSGVDVQLRRGGPRS